MAAYTTGKHLDVAHVVELDLHRRLESTAEHVTQLIVAHAVLQHIPARVDMVGAALFAADPFEAFFVINQIMGIQRILDLVEIGSCWDI